jgi:general secretion pathway protein K
MGQLMTPLYCHNHRQMCSSAGSVLLAVLCLVAVLSFIVISTLGVSVQHADMQQARQGMMRARQLAEMGVAVAANPMIKPGDPALRGKISAIESFKASMTTEEARLNLNFLLTPQRLPILEHMFTSWGLSPADAQGIAACFMDWVDVDDLKIRPDSAERAEYESLGHPDLPSNHLLDSLDELDLVARSDEVRAVRPDWRSFFTLRGNGQLDVNEASAAVLAALTGASLTNAELLVSHRNGLDGVAHTLDDIPLASLEEALVMLGGAGIQTAEILPLLTLHGTTLRIESIGSAGDTSSGIAVSIMRDGGGGARIVEWREFVVEGGRS